MGTLAGLAAIPWRFVDHDLMKIWLWQTPHFEARVTADLNSFTWDIGDLVASVDGDPRPLVEGRAATFATAESEVREAIGKSYPATYGYAPYAGALATTFTLATGERVDLSTFAGQRAVVTVRLPSGAQQVLIGHAQVVHYELHLVPDSGSPVRIQPAHIAKIVGEGGEQGRSAATTGYLGIGRIYRGNVTRGCTGRPGFMPDTVDHLDGPCGIHEDGTRRV